MASINLDDKMMEGVFAQAIANTLAKSDREVLIQSAIMHLITKDNSTYGRSISPLTKAFNDAAESVAVKYIREQLEGDESFKSKCRQMIDEATTRVFNTENIREKTIQTMADAIASALTKDNRY